MNTLEILKGAREIISDESHWTQEEYARAKTRTSDGMGQWRNPGDPDAICWCSIGAIAKAAGFVTTVSVWNRELSEAFNRSESSLEKFNDSHTHSEVLAIFDEAIARLESATR